MVRTMKSHRKLFILPDTAKCIEIVLDYLADGMLGHRLTVDKCDRHAGGWEMLTREAILSTRRPFLNSRISNAQVEWFLDRGRSAPFASLEPDDDIREANPVENGGLYDRMLNVYEHFWTQAPAGVSVGKIHKVLYVMRPRLFPILDSRVQRLLKPNAVAVAEQTRLGRGEYDRGKSNYWGAVRLLQIGADQTLDAIRKELLKSEDDFIRQSHAFLTDLRLLDMVLWKVN